MPEDARRHENNGQHGLDGQPHNDFGRVCLTEQFAAVLDAQDSLAEHDGAVHPALRPHSLAGRVGCVDVVLPTK